MKNIIKTTALCVLATSSVFAASDDYNKKISTPYGKGVILQAGADFVEFLRDNAAIENKVEITVRDIDGQDVKKVIRYQVEGFLGFNETKKSYHNDSRSGLFPFTLSLRAEDGEDLTVEEAKIALSQVQDKETGFMVQFLQYAQENGIHYTSDALEKLATANLLTVKLSDNVVTFGNDSSIVFNGYLKGGWVTDVTSYGQDTDADEFDSTQIEYGAAVGYKMRNAAYGAHITPEVYHRKINLNGDDNFDVTRNGVQVAVEKAFSKTTCSAALGYAEEDVEGNFSEELEEIYIQTKCEF